VEIDEEKQARINLKAAFSGRGIVGLREILSQGCVLAAISDGQDGIALHNDRIAMIEIMVGPDNMAKLLDYLCKGIVSLLPEQDEEVERGPTAQEKRRTDYRKGTPNA